MHVVYDHQIFVEQEHGGISRYFSELADHLGRSPGVRTTVFAPLFINRHIGKPAAYRLVGCEVPRVPLTRKLLRNLNAAAVRASMAWLKPDLVHETYFAFTPSAPRGVPTVLTVYDMIHERFPEEFGANDTTTARKRAAVARADHVICISRSTRDDLIELFGVDPARVTAIHLGCALRAEVEREVVVDGEFLLYVGERRAHKNFANFVRAFAASPRLRRDFRIVCCGGGALRPDEFPLLGALGIADRVSQISASDAELAHLYRRARAFVYPSRYEGFGIPVLEAMAHDCPVVTTSAGALAEVVGDAAEICVPNSVDDIARAIEDVVYSDARRAELIAAGREQVAKFSWDRCAIETLAIYRKLVGGT